MRQLEGQSVRALRVPLFPTCLNNPNCFAVLSASCCSETSPARVRGLLISLKEAFIVGGILAG